MKKLLFFPFRAVFFLLRTFLFPWYLRWIFRLHWLFYFVAAIGVGVLAYQTYQFNRLEAELQVADGPPDVSKWSAADTAPYNDEVTLRGIYFTALDQGEFDPTGLKRQFILLADDQGREIKAALVVWPQDLVALERQLAAQGSGDRIVVTVNGSLSSNSEWARMIETELMVMNVPRAQDLVIVEPFIGDRAAAITDRADKTFGTVEVFGVVAGLLALFGTAKFLLGARRTAAKPARGSTKPDRPAQPITTPQASPWGTLQPTSPPPDTPRASTAQKQTPNRAMQETAAPEEFPLPQLAFKSVFSGGGSGFRFKSADEIILQSFGTLSTLKPLKQIK